MTTIGAGARVTPPVRPRAWILAVVIIAAVALAAAYAASGSREESRATQTASTRAEAASLRSVEVETLPLGASDSTTARSPLLRVYLAQPLTYEAGLPIFRGYVQNDYSSNLTNVRLEVTHADGSIARYAIAATISPGERVAFEFRETRSDLQGLPKFFFLMSR